MRRCQQEASGDFVPGEGTARAKAWRLGHVWPGGGTEQKGILTTEW